MDSILQTWKSYLFFSLLLLLGCNEKSIPKDNTLQVFTKRSTNKSRNVFEIRIVGKVTAEDFLDCFYVLDSIDERFSESRKVRILVSSADDLQDISFILPEFGRPFRFRIDLGRNDKRTEMDIRRIDLDYNGKVIQIPGSLVPYFFDANEFVTYGDSGSKLFLHPYKGRFNPYLTSSALLDKKMKIEFQQ